MPRNPGMTGHNENIFADKRSYWYRACELAAEKLKHDIPEYYRSRTFSGILGDIKALPPRKALSLLSRKKGLGLQYAYLYLTGGIDRGRGYQACAAEALAFISGNRKASVFSGNVLDVGSAVGVTSGVLGLDHVTGFDLFPDILKAAKLVDSITGVRNSYVSADMTVSWPFRRAFDTVVCGLVCHHLKEQGHVAAFFTEANRVLHDNGNLVLTLPSGSISNALQLETVVRALEMYGFTVDRSLTGLVRSTDSTRSLFWMFVIVAEKTGEPHADVFIDDTFGFQRYRTPLTREDKGKRIRESVSGIRSERHESFELIGIGKLAEDYGDTVLVFDNVREIC